MRTKIFFDHFSKLFEGSHSNVVTEFFPRIKNTPKFSTEDFTTNEVSEVTRELPAHKAAGLDGVTNEVLCIPELLPTVTHLLNLLLHGQVEQAQKDSMLVPLPKKGNLDIPQNWRGISLMQHLSKLFDKLMMLRLRSKIDPLLLSWQNGFRQHRATTHHVLAVSQLLDIAWSRKGYHIHAAYVDFSKAFDSVSWWSIEDCLNSWGVPQVLIGAIMGIMKGHSVKVRNEGKFSEPISVQCGVLQGDTLAPFLFVLLVDGLLRRLDVKKGVVISNDIRRGKRIPALAYADDILLMAHTANDPPDSLHAT